MRILLAGFSLYYAKLTNEGFENGIVEESDIVTDKVSGQGMAFAVFFTVYNGNGCFSHLYKETTRSIASVGTLNNFGVPMKLAVTDFFKQKQAFRAFNEHLCGSDLV